MLLACWAPSEITLPLAGAAEAPPIPNTPKPTAMLRAFKAGAFWRQIGEHFGISQQAAYEAAKKARKRGEGRTARGQGRRPRK